MTTFSNFYGSTASIRKWGARYILVIRDAYGNIVHKNNYKTYKGARIALSLLGDCWRQTA